MQTEIHYPTDCGLLVDSMCVLSRLATRAKEVLVTEGALVRQ